MTSKDQPPLPTVKKCAAIGALCCFAGAFTSVALTSSFGRWDEKNGIVLPILILVWLTILLVPIGALAGGVVGVVRSRRAGRNKTP